MNRRRDFIKKIGISVFALSSGIISDCSKHKKKPNILWIISEDTSADEYLNYWEKYLNRK